jgi:GIY-YIG catalytic domain
MPGSETEPQGVPQDVAAIRLQIRAFLNKLAPNGKKIGNAKWGVYAFYDYDGEPIYVGQTNEMLRSRISRHLTNQRTDAVAMNVLDPFEVAEIEVWPLWYLQNKKSGDVDSKLILNSAEYTVFQYVLKKSSFGAVLNEGDIVATKPLKLPPSMRDCIIPAELFDQRKHPDVRIARRATTIAALARVISERSCLQGIAPNLDDAGSSPSAIGNGEVQRNQRHSSHGRSRRRGLMWIPSPLRFAQR